MKPNSWGKVIVNGREMNMRGTWWRKAQKKPIIVEVKEMPADFQVETLEGVMSGKAGDFLIKGVKGELYPYDREIFLETYDQLCQFAKEEDDN